MKLHFPANEIEKALEEIKTATTANPLYGEVTGKGFWLVGDQGVYLMPNTINGKYHGAHIGKPGVKHKKICVYANECNPDKLEFSVWWENKRASFGGDDGIEFIELATIENLIAKARKGKAEAYLVIDISPKQFNLSVAYKVA
jgi:hypothetical protein